MSFFIPTISLNRMKEVYKQAAEWEYAYSESVMTSKCNELQKGISDLSLKVRYIKYDTCELVLIPFSGPGEETDPGQESRCPVPDGCFETSKSSNPWTFWRSYHHLALSLYSIKLIQIPMHRTAPQTRYHAQGSWRIETEINEWTKAVG